MSSPTLLFDVVTPCVLPGFAVHAGDVVLIRLGCPLLPRAIMRRANGRWGVAHDGGPSPETMGRWLVDGSLTPRDVVSAAWARQLAA